MVHQICFKMLYLDTLKSKYKLVLEQRQYKNDSIQLKVIPILTEWSRSYFVLALAASYKMKM